MAIQMRRGLKRDFDPSKMLPGEWAVSIDSDTQNQIIWMCFSPGIVKRMGTYEDFKSQVQEASSEILEAYEETINEIIADMEGMVKTAKGYSDSASEKAKEAAESEKNAQYHVTDAESAAVAAANSSEDALMHSVDSQSSAAQSNEYAEDSKAYADESKSYAVGTDGAFRPGDNEDCAKAYYEQSKQIRDSFSDIGAVAGVKGNAESSYRSGLVDITPDNIGTYGKEYIDANFVPGYIARGTFTIANRGWHRIAKKTKGIDSENSCTLSIKRLFGYSRPEYQKIQLLGTYDKSKFVCVASISKEGNILTKIRETYVDSERVAYIEIYQSLNSSNPWAVSIEDAIGVYENSNWKVIQPETTQETVAGVTVKAELDLSANFDIGDLLPKDGNAASATKAMQDGNGNVIADTYMKKIIYINDFNSSEACNPGFFIAQSAKNAPENKTGYFSVLVLQTENGSGGPYAHQIAMQSATFNIYVRYVHNRMTFSNWKKVSLTDI